jgi:hypothetical protein
VLDRVFVSAAWEAAFPLCSLTAVTRIGSDHCPLILDNGELGISLPARFFFQNWWFKVVGFSELVQGKIQGFLERPGQIRCSIDLWQVIARTLRQFLKGWGANLGKHKRVFRENLLS